MKSYLMMLCALMFLSACIENPVYESCSGTRDRIDNIEVCIFEKSIIETGFSCPAEFSHQFSTETQVICADGPLSQESIDSYAVELPKLEVDSTQLVFDTIALNDTDVTSVLITNSGNGPLNVFSLKLVENTKDDEGGVEFSKGDDWVESFVLQQNETREISVQYTPKDTDPDEGFLEILSNDPNNPSLQLDILSQGLDARVFSNPKISFLNVPPVIDVTRNKSWHLSSIKNVGKAPLKISDIYISPSESEFSITFPISDEINSDPEEDKEDWPATLEANEEVPIRVYFNPDTPNPTEADLHIISNDTNTPDYTVALVGNSDDVCLEVVTGEDEIDFVEGGIGFANNKTVTIKNCSQNKNLKVSNLGVCTKIDATTCDPTAVFSLKDPLPVGIDSAGGFEVGPQDTVSFVAIYTPTDSSVSEGLLSFNSDDPSKESVVIPLRGEVNNGCPQAITDAIIRDDNQYETTIATFPLQWIEFRGSGSMGRDGRTVDRYEWTIVSQPLDSTSRLSSTSIENPELFLDLAGEYMIELKVYDNEGNASCGDQSLIRIIATPDQDISIQLTWDTPADPDDTDQSGTDLDLHYLHPNGNWNNIPYDIFFNNPIADWGISPDATDDPSLAIDDVNGDGPETINHDKPQNDITYSVGVYYYADHSFGPSYATVRIYIDGVNRFEALDQLMTGTGAFWYVATISWPSRQISAVNQVRTGFP